MQDFINLFRLFQAFPLVFQVKQTKANEHCKSGEERRAKARKTKSTRRLEKQGSAATAHTGQGCGHNLCPHCLKCLVLWWDSQTLLLSLLSSKFLNRTLKISQSRKCATNIFWTKHSARLLGWGSRGHAQFLCQDFPNIWSVLGPAERPNINNFWRRRPA